ncbi:hypothetical protein AKJ47_00275 [candidate division MSBL1 archaeon SCGC-AAA261G05]|uniref:HTH cro/C1-type domain-containing protein n=1 Tax=candidate division MSBL1 archaeon SCGC-AAA261G05 TaxID=1698276 RepID=A0A133VCM0_9EURY|nr:hypothetical protein AKJ47_00275 [candidate division MSBL1 archaeon SCGC-AAA261G05]
MKFTPCFHLINPHHSKYNGGVVNSPFDGLAEYVSRRARVDLVQLVLENGMTQKELANRVGVTQQAVHKWLDPRETHPKNENLDCVINLAFELDRRETRGILHGELLSFASLSATRLNSK